MDHDAVSSDEIADNKQNNDAEHGDAVEQTPRRRRGGRRVVRGAGAAGAAVALTVEQLEENEERSVGAASVGKAGAEGRAERGSTARGVRQARTARQNVRESDGSESVESAESSDFPEDSKTTGSEGRGTSRPRRSTTARRARSGAAADDEADADSRSSRRSARKPRSSRRADATDDESGASNTTRRTRANRAENVDASVETRRGRAARDEDDQSVASSASRRRRPSRDDQGIPEEPDVHGSGRDDERSIRPMTSLLFREPVLPELDEVREAGRGRSRRAYDDSDEFGDLTDFMDEQPRGRRGRSRRLNAEERGAADEVERIEEDLESDDITYLPIDDDRDGEDDGGADNRERGGRRRKSVVEDGDDETPRPRSRRRRRKNVDRDGADEGGERDDEQGSDIIRVSGSRSRVDRDDAEDEEETRGTRRRRRERGKRRESERDRTDERDERNDAEAETTTRRRRRTAKGDSGDSRQSARRSRKQQYIDEITDIEGSTRLEAKKQRRRDNRRERSHRSQIMEQDFLARRENVDRLMVVRERGQHIQVSVIEDDVLVEHYVSDIEEVATVGNIYLGRVQNVLPSMEAAFVDIGQARNGVLYAGEVNWDAARLEGQPRLIESAFKSGDPVLVQVTKDPIGHKGARLTSQVTLAGRFLVLVPSGGMTGVSRKLPERERTRLKSIVARIAPKEMGVIIRTAAEGASEEALQRDLESLERQWERIEEKRKLYHNGKRAKLLQGEPDVAIRVVRDIFNDDFSKMVVEGDNVYSHIEEYLDTMAPDLRDKLVKWDPAEHEGKDVFDKWQIDSQLRKGMERQVYLPSGGSIVIDRTEAMTTVDVNTGRFIGRGKSLEETVTRCNLEAAEEIARQLRLRDIGGMIMIDFVDMVLPANRDLVLRRLVECLARDRTKHQVAEVTSLGLVQMTRKRIGQGLVEAFSEECPTCKGRGFILHDEPTVSSDYADPYAVKGGDPFVHTNKHGHGTTPEVQAPTGSSAAVKAKLAQIAAAAAAASDEGEAEVMQDGEPESVSGSDAKAEADQGN